MDIRENLAQIEQLFQNSEWSSAFQSQPVELPRALHPQARAMVDSTYRDFAQLPFHGKEYLVGEYGCNCGTNTFILNLLFPLLRIRAWDISPEAIEAAKRIQDFLYSTGRTSTENIVFEVANLSREDIASEFNVLVYCGIVPTLTSFLKQFCYSESPYWRESSAGIVLRYQHTVAGKVSSEVLQQSRYNELGRSASSMLYQVQRTEQLFRHFQRCGAEVCYIPKLDFNFEPDYAFVVTNEWDS